MKKFLLIISVFLLSFSTKNTIEAQIYSEVNNQINANEYKKLNSFEYYFYANIDIDSLNSNYIYVRYGASGTAKDTWVNYNLSVTGVYSQEV